MKYEVNGASVTLIEDEILVAGSVKAYRAEFVFGQSWNEYTTKKAVFKSADGTFEQLIIDGVCEIPWEVLQQSGTLNIGVYGESAEKRRPTLWAAAKTINPGAVEGDEAREPTPDTWQQLLGSVEYLAPHISADGIWCVGDMYTGVPATGPQGEQGEKGEKGNTGANGADGADGKDGINGKDGYTPVKGIDYFDGKDGKDGADGYTPQKGVDYYTEADKAEMVSAVLAALPDGDEVSY